MDEDQISQQPYLTFFSEETAEYDVIVDQASSAPNLKEATWGALQPLLPLIAERLGPEEFQLILEYSPMPESFVEQLRAIQEKKAQQPPPPDPEMVKIEAQQKAKEAELQLRQQEATVEMELERQKTAAQLQLEQQKVAAQIQLEREKARANLMIEQERNAMSMQVERERMGFEQERMKGDMALREKSARSELAIKAGMAKMDAQNKAREAGEEIPELEDGEDLDVFGNKALAGALTQMSQAITEMAKANAESQRMMANGISALGSELKDAMTRPKQIVRGPDGRAVGVQ